MCLPFFHVGKFFNGSVAAIHSFGGHMEQIIFDSSYLLRAAPFLEDLRHLTFLRAVYLFNHSNYSHPSFEVVYLFCHRKNGSHPSLKCTVYFDRRTCSHQCLSNSVSSGMFISKKVVSSYAFFQRYYNYFCRILAVIHSNSSVHFSDVKICNHPVLRTHLLSAYFRTPVTVKQTSYRSSYIFSAASIILE